MSRRTHFEHYGKPVAACGARPSEVTKDLKSVTCKACLRTWSYREAKELLNGSA